MAVASPAATVASSSGFPSGVVTIPETSNRGTVVVVVVGAGGAEVVVVVVVAGCVVGGGRETGIVVDSEDSGAVEVQPEIMAATRTSGRRPLRPGTVMAASMVPVDGESA